MWQGGSGRSQDEELVIISSLSNKVTPGYGIDYDR